MTMSSESSVPPQTTLREHVTEPLALTGRQAEDEGLWFVAETVAEAYLQQELRRLTAVVEWHGVAALAILDGAERGAKGSRFEKWNINWDHVVLEDPQSARPGAEGAPAAPQGATTPVAPEAAQTGAPDPVAGLPTSRDESKHDDLPPELLRILRDQGVVVAQDQSVWNLIASWANAACDTASAEPTCREPRHDEQEAHDA